MYIEGAADEDCGLMVVRVVIVEVQIGLGASELGGVGGVGWLVVVLVLGPGRRV